MSRDLLVTYSQARARHSNRYAVALVLMLGLVAHRSGSVSSITAGASTPGWRWAGMMARLSMPSSTIACSAPGSSALHSSAHPSVCRARCLIVDVPRKLVQIR